MKLVPENDDPIIGSRQEARPGLALQPGLIYHPGYFDPVAQTKLVADVRALLLQAPLYTPTMPKTGKAFSVRMSNCGPLGWMSDRAGYRYQTAHPETGAQWPPIPSDWLAAWSDLTRSGKTPDACLINYYGPASRMSLHQDRDERDIAVPIVSISLGAACLFRYGGMQRGDKTKSIQLRSGDALVIGGASRLCFHGVDRLLPGSFAPLTQMGRINLTMRCV